MTSERDGRPEDKASDVPPENGDYAIDNPEGLDPSGAPGPLVGLGRPEDMPPPPAPSLRRIASRPARTAPAPLVSRAEVDAEVALDPPYTPGPYEAEPEQSPLRNPYVLAALAVGAAIVMAIFVVVFLGGGDGNGSSPGVIIDPLTPGPGRGITLRSVAAATLREGPGLDYPALGELPRNQEVEVIGRSPDNRWFMIYYPPGSNLRGWVPSTALNVPSNRIDQIPLVDVTPIPRPTVIVPTSTPEPATPTPDTTPTGTPTTTPGPDLAVGVLANNCQQGAQLIVTVANVGASPVTAREVRLTVATQAGVVRVINTTLTLEPGTTLNVNTDYILQGQTTVTLDLIGAPADINLANNAAVCALPGAAAATPTPPGGGVTPPPIVTSTPGP